MELATFRVRVLLDVWCYIKKVRHFQGVITFRISRYVPMLLSRFWYHDDDEYVGDDKH